MNPLRPADHPSQRRGEYNYLISPPLGEISARPELVERDRTEGVL